jgi:hypothetical protein
MKDAIDASIRLTRISPAQPRPGRPRCPRPGTDSTGWTADPAAATVLVPGDGGTARVPIAISVPADAIAGRVVVTAELDLGSERRGEIAETLLEVLRV